MMDIIVTILAYAVAAGLVLGSICFIVMIIQLFIACCKGKSPGVPSWWIFWDATHSGD